MSRLKPAAASQLTTASSQLEAVMNNTEALNCTVQHPVDLSNVRQLHRSLLSIEKAQRMAEFFSLLGDANRLRILSALAMQELCVCDLAAAVKMSESAV